MSEGKKGGGTGRTKSLAVASVVAVLALVGVVVLGVLYASARVPQDAAARIDGEFVSEAELSDYIEQARIAAQVTEDADFAQYLSSNGLNVATYRVNSINQIALGKLIDKRAAELGLTADEAEVDEQVKAYKKNLAFDDDEIWNDTLAQQGMSDEGIRKQLATNILEQKLYDKEVQHRTASDDETVSYVKAHLVGQTLRHACRLCFTGSDGWDRAQQVYKKLKAAKRLDASSFEELGRAAADEDESDLQQGSYAWSDDAEMSEDFSDVLDSMKQGELSEPTTIDADSATEIVFCDVCYTFPDASGMKKLALDDLPAELQEHVAERASDALWSADCSNYLAWLLARAEITYYPVPKDASYNVDMSLAGTSSSEGAAG